MLTLLGSSKTRAFRPLWLLEELGLDFTHTPSAPRSDALGSHGKVPILDVDGTAITDSTAILTYLADSTGRFTAAPGTVARGQQDAITQLILDELDAVLWTAAKHSFVLPEDRRVPQVKPALAWEFSRGIDRLMQRMTGPFLMGDEIAVPDIIAVHCGGWARVAKFEITDRAFLDYMKRLRSRPAYQRAAARD